MSSFNDILRDIKTLEMIAVLFFSFIGLLILGIDEIWMYVIAIFYVLFRARHHFKSLLSDLTNVYSKMSFKSCLLLVAVNMLFSIGMAVLFSWIVDLYPFLDYLPADDMVEAGFTFAYIIEFISIVVVAPISEEFIFRGVFLSRFKNAIPLMAAILLSSIVFGLLHGFVSFVGALVFGICMCIVYLKTQNIFVSISIHFLNNFIGMALVWIPYLDVVLDTDLAFIIVIILSIISAIYLFKFIKDGYKEVKSQIN